MNSKRGFTIVEILVATTMLVVLLGVGGYVLYTKNTESIPKGDVTPASENAEDTNVESAEGTGTGSVSDDVVQDTGGDRAPILSEDIPETNIASDPVDGPIPDSSSESDGESVQATSPFWDNVLDNIYTGVDSETEEATEPEPEPLPDSEPTSEPDPESTPEPDTAASQTATVTYDNSGFSPTSVTINQGGAVLFVNNSNHSMWVGSNSHPTHIGYPDKSPGDCLGSSFDSCININPGSSWQFVFNSIGSWGYHNHSRTGKKGTVIVQ